MYIAIFLKNTLPCLLYISTRFPPIQISLAKNVSTFTRREQQNVTQRKCKTFVHSATNFPKPTAWLTHTSYTHTTTHSRILTIVPNMYARLFLTFFVYYREYGGGIRTQAALQPSVTQWSCREWCMPRAWLPK